MSIRENSTIIPFKQPLAHAGTHTVEDRLLALGLLEHLVETVIALINLQGLIVQNLHDLSFVLKVGLESHEHFNVLLTFGSILHFVGAALATQRLVRMG